MGELPWAALAIPLRDILACSSGRRSPSAAATTSVNTMGKAATWLLYLSVGCVVTHQGAPVALWIFWAGFALAITSLLAYMAKVGAR